MHSLYIGVAFYIVSYGNLYGFWCGNVHCFIWKSVWFLVWQCTLFPMEIHMVFGVAMYIVSYGNPALCYCLTKKIIGKTF